MVGALLFLLPFVLSLGFLVYYGDVEPECDRIRAQDRVRFLLSRCELDLETWHKSVAPYPTMDSEVPHRAPRSIFASSDRSAVYVVFASLDHPWPSSMVKIDRATGEPRHVLWSYSHR